jgi:hypothetical protein
MKPQIHFTAPLASLQRWGLLVGVVAAVIAAIGAWFDPAGFFPAYLVAFLFWLGVSLGCLAVAMLHHLTGGSWGIAIRRILEAGYGALPLLALAFVPLVFGLEILYLWARPEEVAQDAILQGKARYLNVEAFELRAAGYFLIWLVFGFVLNRLSSGRDPADERRRRRGLALVSGPGLVLWGLTITFAAVDWAMSLEPHWFSSMYGVLFIGGQGVSGLAFAIVALVAMRRWQPWNAVLTPARLHDLGNLLLAFVLFWSYVSFMQFLIIWTGNLPEETPWYLHRVAGGWQAVAIVLATLHFLVPFLLLLGRQNKRQPERLWPIAALLILMRLTDLFWLVMPTFSHGGFLLHWMLPVNLAALGGLWLAVFAWRLTARAELPVFELTEAEEALDDVAPAHR